MKFRSTFPLPVILFPAVFMIAKSSLMAFHKDIQDAIVKAEKEARDYERQFSAQLDEQLVESLKRRSYFCRCR